MTFAAGSPGPTSHRTITGIQVVGGRMVVHEADGSFDVPLTEGWTVAGDHIAASACTLSDGRIAVDIVLLASPHRLEIVLDIANATFVSGWPLVPLFGAGIDNRLAAIRPPD
jgi:hypothetical protein